MFSAVRVGGMRLYELARKGVEIERRPRPIEITRLGREAFAGDELVIDVECSKGTYVRTLAMEIGVALGCGAYLTALRRTAVGPFGLAETVTLEALAAESPEQAWERLLPVEVLVRGLGRRECAPEEAARFMHGQDLEAAAPPGAELAVFGPDGRFLGVGLAGPGERLLPLRLMATGERSEAP